MLDTQIKQQLAQYLQLLESAVTIKLSAGADTVSQQMTALVSEIAEMSELINVEHVQLARTPSFQIGDRITFAGLPMGHEFTSLIMALLQVSGRKPKVDDEVIDQIKQLQGTYEFTTYVSLSCHNCPDVVQALNILSVVNPNITHTMVDGSAFKNEVERKNILAVPYVELNGEMFGSGRMSIADILTKLGSQTSINKLDGKEYDVLIVGGGPAGASAAIYAARKGIKTAIVADWFGGQVSDTLGIENLIGTKYTEGPMLVSSIEQHVKEYGVDIFNLQRAKSITKNKLIEVGLEGGATIKGRTVIIATGATWRTLNVPGEAEFRNRGVSFCPHCDGPMFNGERIAVIGGGNSGVEAAIDLAGVAGHVTLLARGNTLKADQVLQNRLYSLPNVTVIKNASTTAITGKDSVDGVLYTDTASNTEHRLDVEGVFVQVGLVPNTAWLNGAVAVNKYNEIEVDAHGQTSIPGVFAAGDCTTSPYKQIIISMGSGATAALGAFDYLIRE